MVKEIELVGRSTQRTITVISRALVLVLGATVTLMFPSVISEPCTHARLLKVVFSFSGFSTLVSMATLTVPPSRPMV